MNEDGHCIWDIKRRIGLASAVVGELSKIWKLSNSSVKTKIRFHEADGTALTVVVCKNETSRRINQRTVNRVYFVVHL